MRWLILLWCAATFAQSPPTNSPPVTNGPIGAQEIGTAWSIYGVKNLNASRSAQWSRVPKLSISHDTVSLSVPTNQTVNVMVSSNLLSWSLFATNLTGDGFPHPIVAVTNNVTLFFKTQ